MQEMKYFNEGNNCDICKNQLMTGRDGTVEDCRRRQNGLSCRFEERDIRTCPVCEHEVDREDMYFTKDCHGIPFRLVCDRCYPVYMGDLKEAITLFDRNVITIDMNDKAAGLWEKDMTGIKVRDRFDVQPVDDGAIIKGNITEVVQG